MQDVRRFADGSDSQLLAEVREAQLEGIVVELLEKNEKLRQQLIAAGGRQLLGSLSMAQTGTPNSGFYINR
jgi:hypothetical protein